MSDESTSVDEKIATEAEAPVEAPAEGNEPAVAAAETLHTEVTIAPTAGEVSEGNVPTGASDTVSGVDATEEPVANELQDLLYEVEAKLREAGHYLEAEFDAIRAKL